MNALRRRSIERQGRWGLAALTAAIALGITLFTVSVSLFFAALIGILLLTAFTASSVLLLQQLGARKQAHLRLSEGKGR